MKITHDDVMMRFSSTHSRQHTENKEEGEEVEEVEEGEGVGGKISHAVGFKK